MHKYPQTSKNCANFALGGSIQQERHFLFFLFFFFSFIFSLRHTMKYFITGSSGVPNISELVGAGLVDDIPMCYCDGSNKVLEPRQDWVKNMLKNNSELLEWHTEQCFKYLPDFFRALIIRLKQQFNQTGGVHVIQRIESCDWDEDTGEVTGLIQYGYNGEGFLEFDLKTLSWIALKPEADLIKQRWDADKDSNKDNEIFLTEKCPEGLKMYLDYGKSYLQRKVRPSVFLLQKTPSSPVSCHATGFYDRAIMSWRKDGKQLQEGMDNGEILPNNDGTFQMSVNLNVSSVRPEDWNRYDCVFQVSDVDQKIVNKLDKTLIRTNWGKKHKVIPIILVVLVLVVIIAAVGFAVYKKKKVSPLYCFGFIDIIQQS
ncbi:adenylate cyclase 2 [Sarotherodon galilaeus]